MKKIYSIHDAKTHFSKLIKEVLAGKNILIANRSEPVVSLSIYRESKRRLGSFEGQGWIADDFDDELEQFSEHK